MMVRDITIKIIFSGLNIIDQHPRAVGGSEVAGRKLISKQGFIFSFASVEVKLILLKR